MKTIHRTTIVGSCPLGCVDVYTAEFHVTGGVLPVEQIQEAINAETKEPVYQENLTKRLADRLGVTVVTFGTHSRFQTECRVEPGA